MKKKNVKTNQKIIKSQPKGDTSPKGGNISRPKTNKGASKTYKNIKKVKGKFVVGKKRKVVTNSLAKAKKIDRTKAYFKFRNK